MVCLLLKSKIQIYMLHISLEKNKKKEGKKKLRKSG